MDFSNPVSLANVAVDIDANSTPVVRVSCIQRGGGGSMHEIVPCIAMHVGWLCVHATRPFLIFLLRDPNEGETEFAAKRA